MTTGPAIPAAWYPDPRDADRLRWWDGAGWTAHTRARVEVPEPEPTSGLATEPGSTPGPDPKPEPNSAPDYVPMSGFASESTGFAQATAPSSTPRTSAPTTSASSTSAPTTSGSAALMGVGSSTTFAVWMLAILPIAYIAVVYTVATNIPVGDGWAIVLGSYGVVAVLGVLAAVRDGRSLERHRVSGAPTPVLGLVPPLYLVVRTLTVGRASLLPLVIWLMLAGVAALFASTLITGSFEGHLTGEAPASSAPVEGMDPPFTAAQSAYLLTQEGMEAKLTHDFEAEGQPVDSVECEPLPSTEVSELTTCVMTSAIIELKLEIEVTGPSTTGTPWVIAAELPGVG